MSEMNISEKKMEECMEMARDIAKNYFRQGLNCTECVIRTFMDMNETALPEEVICMGTGFGGGIGQTKNICGAITGACMAVGMIKGRRDPCEEEDMKERVKQLTSKIYPVFGCLIKEIEEEYGTLICRELSDPFGDFKSKNRKKNCMQIIGYCASLAEKYAFSNIGHQSNIENSKNP